MPPLADLLARLREAASGSADLDKAILSALGKCVHPFDAWRDEGCQSDTGMRCGICGADSWGNKGKNGEEWYETRWPKYTRSIDAAMTLRPAWAKYLRIEHYSDGYYVWFANHSRHAEPNRAQASQIDDLPRALCIAALAARQEKPDAE